MGEVILQEHENKQDDNVSRLCSEQAEYTCTHCGFLGRTRSGLPPILCGKCKSPYWNRPRIRNVAKAKKVSAAPKGTPPPTPPSETPGVPEKVLDIENVRFSPGAALMPPPNFFRRLREVQGE